ncbi:MAG: tRNA-5-carboxymethylaminomethyl-2-thiouridine(34)synthesis protein MnmG [uncultured Thermomicrobiales bacterium]|uniref:tRNA uridine 5-carboxymethylaminomethyl modification enzyme MnmG n=1 Tax=uncultured Thermomicrobiales bacterium TaxID=1645740 RepID=A0A6J4UP01_9BACT|nr:MAG: tRNA-5-carboxymethylaminomethyl-2-thiouridine(34)synthesis protein MnmG [uncultured Thermomicrobiales bacterium]
MAGGGTTLFDVIVVGGGHAACEAALAAARMGAETLLLTANLDTIALMPCNPSIGGPAKGHLVREIDALGGAMAEVTDRTAIQIRTLNSSKGPAVQAIRAQCDKRLYAMTMKEVLEEQDRLTLRQELVTDLPLDLGGSAPRVREVVTQAGNRYRCRAAVLTTGTFLRARMIAGGTVAAGGRAGEGPANELSAALGALGFRLRRLKTGTPPRIDARSIDFGLTTPQPGSPTPLWFSHAGTWGEVAPIVRAPLPIYPQAGAGDWRTQMCCYLIHTNEAAHEQIRANIDRAPMYDGTIEGVGPRYCPSIEDKVVRFPQKGAHQLFLEPEGWRTSEVYVQGANTSLPHDVQWALLRAIPALRGVAITRFGYAVEYDAVDVGELTPTLEAKRVGGLFCAGQVNGTSGYEEAAGQGLVAGVNAARHAAGAAPVILRRDQGYLGVMIDDLVTQEFVEPYRMLTSRVEYRLLLRGDNADLRLTPLAYDLGLVSRERYERARAKETGRDATLAALAATRLTDSGATQAALAAAGLAPLGGACSALDLLRRPHAEWAQVAAFLTAHVPPPGGLPSWAIPATVAEQVMVEAQYAHYIDTQRAQVRRLATMEGRAIPRDFAFAALPNLRAEAREKLLAIRPATLGQAGRIAGVTPSDLAGLLVALERHERVPSAE